ncbi:MAG: hypothetical protein IKK51_02400 [Oscillospiraceae bacterium]|nr:hypothetical protein [Oscillospiraceae bacterium]MBR4100716.1 hypothetical protein [Oscillospiraceae bacterium]
MSKAKKIVITVIAVLLVLSLAAGFFVPRIMLAVATSTIINDVVEPATYFTEFDVRNEDVQTIDNGHIAIDIPKELIKKDENFYNLSIYKNADESASIILMDPLDLSDLNIMREGMILDSMIHEAKTPTKISISSKQLLRGFEAMGNCIPDSAYNTYKCCYLTSKDDNSFWNINQASAFLVAGSLKSIMATYGPMQIYESDSICGFVSVTLESDGISRGLLEVYSTDDLNTVTGILVKGMDSNDVYAIMNSARACE